MNSSQISDSREADRLKFLSVAELLMLHAQIGEELRDRRIVRSANNPTGDLAEYLFCKAFGWQQAPNSERGYDATEADGTRYQIKGRRIHRRNKSRQLSAIRDIDGGHFDMLAGVLFDDDFKVMKAALVPVTLVSERSTYIAHTNSNKFILRDDVWSAPGVRDVTAEIAAAMQETSNIICTRPIWDSDEMPSDTSSNDEPGDLSRFSGTAESVSPLGRVVRQTWSDQEGEKAPKEAQRILDEARKSA